VIRSLCAFFACAILLVISGAFFYPRWQKWGNEAQLSWDAGGYYWYLPAVFIYKDVKQQHFRDSIMQRYQPTPPNDFQYAFRYEGSDNLVIRYTMGTALLEAPWFFIAHAIAKPMGYPADGFAPPYQFMIWLGGILFAILGLWYLRRLLLQYYSDSVTAIVLLLLVAGTNYLNYAGIDTGMTHGWLFTLYVLILHSTDRYYRTLQRKYILRTGALIGLAALVRPPEIISVLIPLLWGMDRISVAAIRERLMLFKRQIRHIVPAALICLLILSLQFCYWQYASGRWFIYTYQEQGFSWLKPHLKLYALNYQCGWLLYTPLMFFALAGLVPFLRSGRNRLALLSLVLVNYYIVAAWDAWDYGGRAMIQNYPALLFPLASLVAYLQKRKISRIIGVLLLLPAVWFNLWWTYQAHRGTLIGSAPATRAYYFATIFRFRAPEEIQKLRDNEDLYRKPIQHPVQLYANSCDTFPDGHIMVEKDLQQILNFSQQGKKYKWIRASADVHIGQKEWNVWFMTHFMIRLKKGNDVIQANSLRVQRFLKEGETRNITVDLRVKYDVYDNIELVYYNENNGILPCSFDNITVTGFDK